MPDDARFLESLRVASPCSVPWEGMTGDDRVRRCAGCRKNVYNLSAMTRTQAEDLVRGTEGRLCVRFFRRVDGTVLTADCPVGLRAVRRRLAMLGGALAAMFLGLFAAGCGRTAPRGGDPDPVPTMGKPVMGDVVVPSIQGEVSVPEPR